MITNGKSLHITDVKNKNSSRSSVQNSRKVSMANTQILLNIIQEELTTDILKTEKSNDINQKRYLDRID